MAHLIRQRARLAAGQSLGPILRLAGITALLLVLSTPVAVMACDTGSDSSTPAKTKKR